jgi:hypothetical protein
MTVEWLEDSQRVTQYVNQHSGSFAGRWVIQGEEHVVAFTEDLEEHEAALRILLHAPDQLRVVQMRHTWNHLTALTKQMPSILGGTDGVTGWGPDVKENLVVVGVRPERIDAVRTLLQQSHPDDVRVEPGEWAVAF